MQWWYFLLLFVVGIVVGFVNTLAGSGSFLTFPVLVLTGMPAPVANGTNRISILLQSLTGVLSFRRKKMLDVRTALILSAFTIPGALAGSLVVVDIPGEWLQKMIGYIMVVFAILTLWKPGAFSKAPQPMSLVKIRWYHALLFLAIGFYGGFIQAGVGIFMLFSLVLAMGFDLVRANAIKLALTFVFTPFALVVFIINDQVDWIPGLVLAAGSMIGAWWAARLAIKKGSAFIRIVLFIVLAASSIKLILD